MRIYVAARIPGTYFLRNLVERRTLLVELVRRDFQQRFVGSAIGWIWGLIHPLVLLLTWTFIFQYCLTGQVPAGEDTHNYPLWLFAGMLPWLLFSDTVQRAASSLPEQANLITKTVFPSEIIPVSVFLSSLVSHFLGLALMLVAAGVVLKHISAFLILLPVYILLVGLLGVGLGWIAASLHVFLRDTAQMVSVLLMFWFWMTPIFLPPDLFPRWARVVLLANPFYYVVKGYRKMLLGSSMPSLSDIGIVAVCAATAFLAGGLFFRHMKRGFADVL
jgi:ABC-type polysaccharide/polyol phosphate export permease